MFNPKPSLYKKYQKGKKKALSVCKSKDILQFGRFGIKAKKALCLKSNTLEAVRRDITRKIKPYGMLWIRVFPNKAVSQKPLSTRMGKGKGQIHNWYVSVSAGKILFEMDGIPMLLAKQAFLEAQKKLPNTVVLMTDIVSF